MVDKQGQDEKIIKMRLQTARILWHEHRKDAAFLVLESVSDPRADDLRHRMGFDDDYDVGSVTRTSFSWPIAAIVIVLVIVISFLAGSLIDFNSQNSQSNAATENEAIATVAAPSLEANQPITQPLIEMTSAASQIQLTGSAIEQEQNNSMSLLDATETARYEQATETQNALETTSAQQ